MRYLIISDIHSNWEALQAVLEAADGQYDRILCCGDFIGYGADPNSVLNWSRANVDLAIRGNHDRACTDLEDLEWFNPVAKTASLWTHDELSSENAEYIRQLPKGPLGVEDFQILHGSPLNEDEYVSTLSEAEEIFQYLEAPLVFFGHTHLQGGFLWRRQRVEPIAMQKNEERRLLDIRPDSAYFVNPGSVGQPRDSDPRAGFVLFDSEEKYLFYHRVPYDFEAAQRKIRQAGLPDLLAVRLELGR